MTRWVAIVVLLLAMGAAVPAWGDDAEDCANAETLGKTDAPKVIAACRHLAEQGQAHAQMILGLLYASGNGVPQDHAEAGKWYRQAAEQGLAEAQYLLGNSYARGNAVPQNHAEAAMWFRRAAEQGMAVAQLRVASRYTFGLGLPLDYVQAHMWYSIAMRQSVKGDETFQDAYGWRERVGQSMTQAQIKRANSLAAAWRPKSPSEVMSVVALPAWTEDRTDCHTKHDMAACRWLAEKGDAETQLLLGTAYRVGGFGLSQDDAEALKWFHRAADQGDWNALILLGRMYEEGAGVPQDNVQALAWYTLATLAGLPPRLRLAATMSQSDIERAQTLVSEWRAAHPDWPDDE